MQIAKRLTAIAIVTIVGSIAFSSVQNQHGDPSRNLLSVEFAAKASGLAAACLGLVRILWLWTGVDLRLNQLIPSIIVIFAALLFSSQSWAGFISLAALVGLVLYLDKIDRHAGNEVSK